MSRKALEQLQESVHGRSTDLVKLKDGKPAGKAAPEFGPAFPAKQKAKIFGDLADSGALATAVDGVEKKAGDQLDDAKERLDDVERALDQVRRNLRDADTASTPKDPS